MNETLDTFFDFDKHTEIRHRTYRAVDPGVQRITLRHRVPRVGGSLFDPQANPLLFHLDPKHYRLYLVTLLIELGGMPHLLRPRQIGDVDQAIDTRFDFDEYAKIRQ